MENVKRMSLDENVIVTDGRTDKIESKSIFCVVQRTFLF